ncbi:MAG: hypothetical protein B7Y37_13410 [Sphingobacteriia bacterium 28-36-52]|nr:MAG: hypothetical protein B7Y37_13410 [Sphingobacteriia bacterium 28-36-52]
METSEPSKKNYSFFTSDKEIKQYEIWKVEWRNNPNNIQLVVIVQTNYLNNIKHFSYIVCPLVVKDLHRFWILRLWLNVKGFGSYEILIDQITSVSGEALLERIDELNDDQRIQLRRNLGIVLGFTL